MVVNENNRLVGIEETLTKVLEAVSNARAKHNHATAELVEVVVAAVWRRRWWWGWQ
jgi:hypothetical protein